MLTFMLSFMVILCFPSGSRAQRRRPAPPPQQPRPAPPPPLSSSRAPAPPPQQQPRPSAAAAAPQRRLLSSSRFPAQQQPRPSVASSAAAPSAAAQQQPRPLPLNESGLIRDGCDLHIRVHQVHVHGAWQREGRAGWRREHVCKCMHWAPQLVCDYTPDSVWIVYPLVPLLLCFNLCLWFT